MGRNFKAAKLPVVCAIVDTTRACAGQGEKVCGVTGSSVRKPNKTQACAGQSREVELACECLDAGRKFCVAWAPWDVKVSVAC